jgi:hypothetical protein
MNSAEQPQDRARHFCRQMRGSFVANRVPVDHANQYLKWGQFITPPNSISQVGVLGSTSAAIVLGLLGNDDNDTRSAKTNLENYYITEPDANNQLCHNLKLAMMALALCPALNAEASQSAKDAVGKLISRAQTDHIWPAFTPLQSHQHPTFVPANSHVATALILILLRSIFDRLSNNRDSALKDEIESLSKRAGKTLQESLGTETGATRRFRGLIATAVILALGSESSKKTLRCFKDALVATDFTERIVFFYDCIIPSGVVSRDYFIIPPAVILPIIASRDGSSQHLRAMSQSANEGLFSEISERGLYSTGQEYPSSVEQAFVGLSLEAIADRSTPLNLQGKLSHAWIYLTQMEAGGSPTTTVKVTMAFLWTVTAGLILVRTLHTSFCCEHTALNVAFQWLRVLPEPVSTFLAFLCGALPASKVVFSRFIGKQSR